MVDKAILPKFVAELKTAMKEFYPNGTKASPDYGRIVNGRQWARLKKMVDQSSGKILMGGEMEEKGKFIEPTVIQIDDVNDSLMVEESFGPLMPILPFDDLDQAIKIAGSVHSTPLGLYPFGNKKETDQVLRELRSGGASVNDAYFHGSLPTLAFGGVGDSGQGAYRGQASFDCFTHRRSITSTPGWMERLIAVRYPPYEGKLAQLRRMSELKPNFDREGKVKSSLVISILSLGAGSTLGGLTRYAVVFLSKCHTFSKSRSGEI